MSFLPENSPEFQAFLRRQREKAARYPVSVEELTVDVCDPAALTPGEKERILRNVADYNFSFYRWGAGGETRERSAGESESLFSDFAAQLGALHRDDHLCARNGISRIEPVDEEDHVPERGVDPRSRFIPYSRRPIGPHTDGYYQARSIRSILLHCVIPSPPALHEWESGLHDVPGGGRDKPDDLPPERPGENFFIDHELLCFFLYSKEPAWARALSAPDAFTVPEDDLPGDDLRKSNRPRFTGAVFSFENGHVFMRYSNRPKNIIWKDDEPAREALAALKELIAQIRTTGNPLSRYLVTGSLETGMGVAGRNVVHGRSAFFGERLILRIRSFDELRVG